MALEFLDYPPTGYVRFLREKQGFACPTSKCSCISGSSCLVLWKILVFSSGGETLITLKIPLWYVGGAVCLEDGKNCVLRW